jgi:hypothetical protein
MLHHPQGGESQVEEKKKRLQQDRPSHNNIHVEVKKLLNLVPVVAMTACVLLLAYDELLQGYETRRQGQTPWAWLLV